MPKNNKNPLNMKPFLTLALSFFALTAMAQNPFLGKWKTIDDETGRIKSVVEITERDGKLYGQIIELFRLPEEDQNPICDECEDDRKDQPALGMEIVRDMVPVEANWSGKTAPFAIRKMARFTTAKCGSRRTTWMNSKSVGTSCFCSAPRLGYGRSKA